MDNKNLMNQQPSKKKFGYGKASNFIFWIIMSLVGTMIIGFIVNAIERLVGTSIPNWVGVVFLILIWVFNALTVYKAIKNGNVSMEHGRDAISFSGYGFVVGVGLQLAFASALIIHEMRQAIAILSVPSAIATANDIIRETILNWFIVVALILVVVIIVRVLIFRSLKNR